MNRYEKFSLETNLEGESALFYTKPRRSPRPNQTRRRRRITLLRNDLLERRTEGLVFFLRHRFRLRTIPVTFGPTGRREADTLGELGSFFFRGRNGPPRRQRSPHLWQLQHTSSLLLWRRRRRHRCCRRFRRLLRLGVGRSLLALWLRRRPLQHPELFERLEHLVNPVLDRRVYHLRNVALLHELGLFFELADFLGRVRGLIQAVHDDESSDQDCRDNEPLGRKKVEPPAGLGHGAWLNNWRFSARLNPAENWLRALPRD